MTQTLTYIAITSASGSLKIRQIVTVAERRAFSDEAALKNGYALTEDGTHWVRDLDDDAEVVAEMERAGDDYSGGWRRIDPSDLPSADMRIFRNVWRDAAGTIDADLPAARDIVRDKIREARKPMFEELDASLKPLEIKAALGTMTADEKRTMLQIEAQRQALRDAPADPAIDAAATAGDLKAHLQSFL